MSILRRKSAKKYKSEKLIGLSFNFKGSTSPVYTIIPVGRDNLKDNFVYVTWDGSENPLLYSIVDIEEYFKEGDWIKI